MLRNRVWLRKRIIQKRVRNSTRTLCTSAQRFKVVARVTRHHSTHNASVKYPLRPRRRECSHQAYYYHHPASSLEPQPQPCSDYNSSKNLNHDCDRFKVISSSSKKKILLLDNDDDSSNTMRTMSKLHENSEFGSTMNDENSNRKSYFEHSKLMDGEWERQVDLIESNDGCALGMADLINEFVNHTEQDRGIIISNRFISHPHSMLRVTLDTSRIAYEMWQHLCQNRNQSGGPPPKLKTSMRLDQFLRHHLEFAVFHHCSNNNNTINESHNDNDQNTSMDTLRFRMFDRRTRKEARRRLRRKDKIELTQGSVEEKQFESESLKNSRSQHFSVIKMHLSHSVIKHEIIQRGRVFINKSKNPVKPSYKVRLDMTNHSPNFIHLTKHHNTREHRSGSMKKGDYSRLKENNIEEDDGWSEQEMSELIMSTNNPWSDHQIVTVFIPFELLRKCYFTRINDYFRQVFVAERLERRKSEIIRAEKEKILGSGLLAEVAENRRLEEEEEEKSCELELESNEKNDTGNNSVDISRRGQIPRKTFKSLDFYDTRAELMKLDAQTAADSGNAHLLRLLKSNNDEESDNEDEQKKKEKNEDVFDQNSLIKERTPMLDSPDEREALVSEWLELVTSQIVPSPVIRNDSGQEFSASDIVLFEDDWILVCNKPVGIVMHPCLNTGDAFSDSLVNFLLHHSPELRNEFHSKTVRKQWLRNFFDECDERGWGEVNSGQEWNPMDNILEPGIVHRLDRGTSGLVVCAKKNDPRLMADLRRQFAEHSSQREYLALAHGALPKPTLTVRNWIEKEWSGGSNNGSSKRNRIGDGDENTIGKQLRFRVMNQLKPSQFSQLTLDEVRDYDRMRSKLGKSSYFEDLSQREFETKRRILSELQRAGEGLSMNTDELNQMKLELLNMIEKDSSLLLNHSEDGDSQLDSSFVGRRSSAKLAVSEFRELEKFEFVPAKLKRAQRLSLVQCRLQTGRTHQVRVQMSHLGMPLISDAVYQRSQRRRFENIESELFVDSGLFTEEEFLQQHRQPYLHAFRLTFDHPISNKRGEFSCQPPSSFQKVLGRLRSLGFS